MDRSQPEPADASHTCIALAAGAVADRRLERPCLHQRCTPQLQCVNGEEFQQGMPACPYLPAEHSTQFWLASRYFPATHRHKAASLLPCVVDDLPTGQFVQSPLARNRGSSDHTRGLCHTSRQKGRVEASRLRLHQPRRQRRRRRIRARRAVAACTLVRRPRSARVLAGLACRARPAGRPVEACPNPDVSMHRARVLPARRRCRRRSSPALHSQADADADPAVDVESAGQLWQPLQLANVPSPHWVHDSPVPQGFTLPM